MGFSQEVMTCAVSDFIVFEISQDNGCSMSWFNKVYPVFQHLTFFSLCNLVYLLICVLLGLCVHVNDWCLYFFTCSFTLTLGYWFN
jgi:hypothetical protein